MFCIFYISGYFIPLSIQKSNKEFIVSKVKRILIPWLLAVFTLIPVYKGIFLFSRGLPQEEWFSYFHLFERAGSDLSFFANNPVQNWLWFLPVLFVFQMIYWLAARLNIRIRISMTQAVLLTLVLGVAYGMIIHTSCLTGWYHSAFLHFQRERLLIYFMAFLLGALSNKLALFENNTKNLKLYILANVVLAAAMTVFTITALNLFFNLIDPSRNYFYVSEFTDKLAYHISMVLLMLSFLYLIIHTFRFYFNKINRVLTEINSNSYSVYIIHTVVLGVIALALLKLSAPAFVKYGILSVLTFVFSNLLIYSWKKTVNKKLM